MEVKPLLDAVAESPLGIHLSESAWLFPAVETMHVLAITLVVGSIAMVDLRLLGWSQSDRRVTEVIGELLPWTWLAFVAAVPTGLILFSAKPVSYFGSWPLRIKLALMVAAGLNMLVFHLVTQRRIAQWDEGRPPSGARVAGALSLILWIGALAAGRWIGFVK